jgi:hypothetical protein
MTQPTLFDDLDSPAEIGRREAERCADAAERRGWDGAAATAFVLAYLAEHGPTPGEVLVTEASRDNPPHDGRAFGAVFGRLSRAGRIVKHGFTTRRKGHGTAGGIIWALAGAKQ